MVRPLIIDCDPGVDDAIALLMAIASPANLDVLGVTTVAGNVPLELTQTNARKICELAGRPDMPVFAGCPRPLIRPLATAADVHGNTGLDGIELPAPTMPLRPEHAVDFIIETLTQATEPVAIAAMGPLTNIAVALVKAPRILDAISEIAIMGGAISQGNITPSAEFNFYVDPHAAHVVLTSGVAIALATLDLTHQVISTPARLARLRDIGRPIGTAAAALLRHYGRYDMERYGLDGGHLHDPCTIAYLLAPHLFEIEERHVAVDIVSRHCMGRSIVDMWDVTGTPPNANVLTQIDADGFYELLGDRLQTLQLTLDRAK